MSHKGEKDSNIYGDSTFKTGLDITTTIQPKATVTLPKLVSTTAPSSARGSTSARASTVNSNNNNNNSVVSFEDELLKLPNVVNFVALRETFLSEAPFIKRSNRSFWKKWIDSKQYMHVFAGSLRIITECITDNGVIHADKLFQIPNEKKLLPTHPSSSSGYFSGRKEESNEPSVPSSRGNFLSRATLIRPNTNNNNNGNSNTNNNNNNNTANSFNHWLASVDVQAVLIEKIAQNLSEMLLMDRNKRSFSNAHDTLFYRLPEILCYMSIQSLLSTIPKLARVFNSVKFRELLIDWFTELINGLKVTDCHHDREWIFKNALDNPIILLNEPLNLSKSYRRMNQEMKTKMKKSLSARLESLENTGKSMTPTVTPFSPTKPMNMTNNSNQIPFMATNKTVTFDSYDTNDSPPFPFLDMMNNQNNNEDNDTASYATSISNSSINANSLVNSRYGAAKSNLILQNSPLVQLYMNMGKKTADPFPDPTTANHEPGYVCQFPLKLTMSHLPNRPIVSMQSGVVHLEGKFRERKMNHTFLKKSLRKTQKVRDEILENQNLQYRQMKYDVAKMNKAYKIQLALLAKKPVTQKELLMAATALESIGKMTGNNNGGGFNATTNAGNLTNTNNVTTSDSNENSRTD